MVVMRIGIEKKGKKWKEDVRKETKKKGKSQRNKRIKLGRE